MAKQSITVYINDQYQFFVNETQASEANLEQTLLQSLAGQGDATIVLRADRTVPIQYVVNVIDAVNNINEFMKTKHKVILATKPPEEAAK